MTAHPAGLDPFSATRRHASAPTRKRVVTGRRSPRYAFSREEILVRIRNWADQYGEPPTMRDWEPSRARRTGQPWRAERFEAGDWPSARMVVKQCGSFTAAIAEAGCSPRQRPSRIRPVLDGREQILIAIREWARRYGQPPTQADWDPVRARRLRQHWRVVRYRDGDWPSLQTVLRHYHSLGNAVRAASLEPRTTGLHGDAVARFRAHNRRLLALHGAELDRGERLTVADTLREVARYRALGDAEGLHRGLVRLAAAALSWADRLTAADVEREARHRVR